METTSGESLGRIKMSEIQVVRETDVKPFCFEFQLSEDQTLVLQATDEASKLEWLKVLESTGGLRIERLEKPVEKPSRHHHDHHSRHHERSDRHETEERDRSEHHHHDRDGHHDHDHDRSEYHHADADLRHRDHHHHDDDDEVPATKEPSHGKHTEGGKTTSKKRHDSDADSHDRADSDSEKHKSKAAKAAPKSKPVSDSGSDSELSDQDVKLKPKGDGSESSGAKMATASRKLSDVTTTTNRSILRRSILINKGDDYDPVLLGDKLKQLHEENPDQPLAHIHKKKKKKGHKHRPAFQFKCNVIGEVIYKGHPSWVLMHNIQIGLRHVVGGGYITPKQRTLVTTRPDFLENAIFYDTPGVIAFPSAGSATTVAHNLGNFKFKDYCPLVFRHLRALFGIDRSDYLGSLCYTPETGGNPLRLMATPGKSGSLFFFSSDMKFILKTIPKREAKILRDLLPPYVKHIAKFPDTLLPKFYGLYRVKPHLGRQVRFVIMNNLFATDKKIHERYDLKGSTVGRTLTVSERTGLGRNATFKDGDFLCLNKALRLGPTRKTKFLQQIERDAEFLRSLGTMDYSLLVGIHSEEIAALEAASPADAEPPLPPSHLDAAPGEFLSMDVNLQPPDLGPKPTKPHKTSPAPEPTTESSTKKDTVRPSRKSTSVKTDTKSSSGADKTKVSSPRMESAAPATTATASSSTTTTTTTATTSTTSSVDASNAVVVEAQYSKFEMIPQLDSPPVISSSLFTSDRGGMMGYDEKGHPTREFYFVGIIDILMRYTMRKSLEHSYKTLRYGNLGEVSSVNPPDYATRFVKFITDVTL
ncbi:phosphatidylinositol-4-phosphate 5-kinase [Pelomyxa schiedti]|nr:phosphatidylinositol-4-phosphate 5-kinase [Pelomyxa schiedti]